MATHHIPEVDKAADEFGQKIKEHLANLDDLGAALDSSTSLDEIMEDYEARRLLRQMPPDLPTN